MYDPDIQYRCTIIRGKSQREIDDRLSTYAKIIVDVCPCSIDNFELEFNKKLEVYISNSTKKTLDNHRTEIAGKLFGMYYQKEDFSGSILVYPSQRTLKYVEDGDQPAFFKDVCYKMQFPNGMSKISTIQDQVKNKIKLRSCCYIIKTLMISKKSGIKLSVDDIGYYLLNSKNVLQGYVAPDEIIERIKTDRINGIDHKVHTDGKAESYDLQHIREQLNYMELANLIYIDDNKMVTPNVREREAIYLFEKAYNVLEFDIYKYNLDNSDDKKQFQYDWNEYFSKLSAYSKEFETTADALCAPEDIDTEGGLTTNTVEIGNLGEQYVYEYEKARVRSYNKKLENKVLSLGKIKGLGFDIQSVVAEDGPISEFPIYIEVKTTIRTTEPIFDSDSWSDSVRLTRNEWVAAQCHKELYLIYRVYIVRGKVIITVIRNIYNKEQSKVITIMPEIYVMDYKSNAIDKKINLEGIEIE